MRAISLCIALLVWSFSSVCCAELKIGVLNAKELENSSYAKDLHNKLEKEFGPKKSSFEAKQKELQSKAEALQRNKDILADKERLAKEQELSRLQQEAQHMYEALDADLSARRQDELAAFNKTVDEVVQAVAKEAKYDLIFPDHIVFFSNKSIDCTSKVLAALEAKYKKSS